MKPIWLKGHDAAAMSRQGLYYPAAEVDAHRAKVRALVEAMKKYQEMAMLLFECKYADLAAVRERFELSCINLKAALAALEFNNE